jgi:hypothetical protein
VTTPPETPLCSRCGQAPRRSGQRWCRECLATYKRARRARLRAGAELTWEPVSPAPVLAETPVERPLVLCYLCGTARWFEWVPNDWRCLLCGRAPAVVHPQPGPR